ncbi:MAG TPA: LPS export ABC transporter periplasmic protein LptC, partial [Thermoanaerobaculia bacterium]|nr:LPS export ABC transporter periplasmic protein LptC [Thermoanaerobaculia bacterium]
RTVGFGAAAGLVPNAYALEKVTLTVYPDQGAAVTVRADQADYDHRTNEAHLKGNVRWVDERNAVGETERLDFLPSIQRLVAPGAIHLSRGTFQVSARSAHYDIGQRELVLEGPVRGTGTGEGSGGLSDLAADGAVYGRDEGMVELTGSVSAASRDGDRISCDRIQLKTEADGKRLLWARALSRVRGTLSSMARGGVQSGTGQRRYAADEALLSLAPDGAARSLALRGAPAELEEPGRRVEAQSIEMAFEAGRAVSAGAQGDVCVVSEGGRADAAHARLLFSKTGDVEQLEFSGAVRLRAEGRSALAERAVVRPSSAVWVLTGPPGGSAVAEKGSSRVSAPRIELDEKRRLLRASGGSRAVFVPEDESEKTPALLGDPSRPTYGKAERIVFDDASRTATLLGGATLWQENASLTGDDITLDDAQKTLLAVVNTRTVFSPAPDPKSPQADRRPAVITAQRVMYHDSNTTARFDGDVTVTRGPWRTSARTAQAFFTRDHRLERVELSGEVTLADPVAGRNGKADRAVDWPREGKTVLEGCPAWVTDAQGNRVSGATLTIADRGLKVEVTAPEGGKTETIHRTSSP